MEERKLKPIYDELENGRAKNALTEIEKYQKRYPKQANSPIIGALKCVALQRQRNDDAAYQSFLAMVRSNSKGSRAQGAGDSEEEIPDDVVIDESTLHTLGYALRPMRKIRQLMKLYQNAWRADPANLDMGVQIFQNAIRIQDWKTMQQTSIKLIGASQDARTAQWAAMSSYLEACQPETPEKEKSLLLSLGRSLLERKPSSPYESEDTLLLYIKILREMGGNAIIEALSILTPDNTQKDGNDNEKKDTIKKWMTDLRFRWERWELVDEIAQCSLKEDWNWEEEFARAEGLIRGGEETPITNYKAYLSYITALMVLLAREKGQKYLQTALETLSDLAQRFGGQERAPLLARLEINRKLRAARYDVEAPSEDNGDDALLKAYWADFGHKGSVLDDLGPYVTAQSDFTATLREAVGIEAADYKEYIRQLNAYKLLQYVSPQGKDAEGNRHIAQEQFRLYLSGAKFGQGLPPTDVKPADDFGLLSAQSYIAAWSANKVDLTDLITAIFVLEKVVRDSPANGHARILLLRLYRLAAAPSLLPQHVQQLKMRTFQQDTVLHMVTERSSSDYIAGGEKGRAMISKLLLNSKGIYESTDREISEAMVSAYSAGSFSQIPGMLKLSQRFGNSHHRFLGELELVRQSALRDFNELTGERAVAVENLARDKGRLEDVRDWDLLPDYLGKDGVSLKDQTATGPLTDATWVTGMTAVWIAILNPEHANVPEVNDSTQASSFRTVRRHLAKNCMQMTEMEKQLVSFAKLLLEFVQSCKAGTTDGSDKVKQGFHDLIKASNEVTGAPWTLMHSWSIVLEAFAMMEITLSPYKPVSGKQAKKGKSSDISPQVGDAVKAILVDSKAALKTLAATATSLSSEDRHCLAGILINALKANGFTELAESSFAKQCETSVRDSRRIAFKEMAKEFKKRADN